MTGVGGNCQRCTPPASAAPPSATGAMLDTTYQSRGASTVSS